MAKNTGKAKIKNKPVHHPPAPKKITPAPEKTGWHYWTLAGLVLLITFIVFTPTFSLHFVNWDDDDNLILNENLKIFSYSWSWDAVKKIFTSGVIGNYNPLPIFTFALEKYFFSPDPVKAPFIFHFNNVWMHLVCTLLVYVLLKKLGLSRWAIFIGALLFGIHPMRVESVAWATERKDVLYGMFFLAALVTYTNYARNEKSRTKWYLLTILLSIFAYFAKIQAVTLPLTMVALDFYFKRKWLSPKILILEKMPWWLLSVAFGLINIYFLTEQKSLNFDSAKINYTFVDRLAVGAYSYGIYLIKWICPYKLSPLYPYPPKLPVQAYIALAVVPLAVIATLVWGFRKKKTDLLFGWAFFTFNVMFLLQIVGAGQGFLADRFTYIAYIGLFFLMAKGYDWITTNKPSYKPFVQLGTGIYFLLFAYLSFNQIKVWENGETLWERVKKYYPDSPMAWKQAGNYYRDQKKDFSEALKNYNEAIRLEPKDAYVYNSVAKIYMDRALSMDRQKPDFANLQQQMIQAAIQNYNQAISLDSTDGMKSKKTSGEIIVNRGVAYAVGGNIPAALENLDRGLAVSPENQNGYLNRGLIYFQQEKWELALKDHDSYIRLNQYNPDMYHERGLIKFALKRPADAIPDFDRAIFLKKDQALFYFWRAKAYQLIGKKQEATRDAKQAQQLGAQVPPELLN